MSTKRPRNKKPKRKSYDELATEHAMLREALDAVVRCKACAGDKHAQHTCDIGSAQRLLSEIKP